MSEWILHTNRLAVGYGGKTVLRELEISLRPGEILTLIGPNGAGKTTVLRTISRQLEPLSGTVFFSGREMDSLGGHELARSLSILMTDRVHGERMTCEDVVCSGRYPYTGRLGILSEHDRQMALEAMELVNVTELRECEFSRVSDGQRQRVMLARAICQEPKVLVMDEPASFLDIRYKLELLTVMRRLASEKKVAMIVSLHELELARKISDKVLCIRDGMADRCGTPEEIFTEEYMETLYQLPRGGYAELFAPAARKAEGGRRYAFFQNRDCENFPCHAGVPEEAFNCLFCYCPLYALGPRCGGNYTYTASGAKSCKNCSFPHLREHYEAVIAHYPELKELARDTEDGDGI